MADRRFTMVVEIRGDITGPFRTSLGFPTMYCFGLTIGAKNQITDVVPLTHLNAVSSVGTTIHQWVSPFLPSAGLPNVDTHIVRSEASFYYALIDDPTAPTCTRVVVSSCTGKIITRVEVACAGLVPEPVRNDKTRHATLLPGDMLVPSYDTLFNLACQTTPQYLTEFAKRLAQTSAYQQRIMATLERSAEVYPVWSGHCNALRSALSLLLFYVRHMILPLSVDPRRQEELTEIMLAWASFDKCLFRSPPLPLLS